MLFRDIILVWLNRLSRAGAFLASLLFAILTLGVFISVFFRYILVSPVGWTEEFTRLLLVWGVMLGMAYTLQKGRHIRVTTLVKNLSPTKKRVLEFCGDLLAIAVLGIFVFKSTQFTAFTRNIGELSQGSLEFPIWYAELALPVGGGLFILQYLAKTVETLMGAEKSENQDTHT